MLKVTIKRCVKMFKKSLLIVTAILLTGCASTIENFKEWTGYYSLSKEECYSGDWYNIGYRDGRADKPRSYLNKHQMSCNRLGININERIYYKGFDNGYKDFVKAYCAPEHGFELGEAGDAYRDICPPELKREFVLNYDRGYHNYIQSYCEPENGFNLGKKNRSYKDICPPHLKPRFVRAHSKGKKVYKLKNELTAVDKKIKVKESELEELVRQLDDIENGINIDDRSGDIERHKIRRKERELDQLAFEKSRIKALLNTIEVLDITEMY